MEKNKITQRKKLPSEYFWFCLQAGIASVLQGLLDDFDGYSSDATASDPEIFLSTVQDSPDNFISSVCVEDSNSISVLQSLLDPGESDEDACSNNDFDYLSVGSMSPHLAVTDLTDKQRRRPDFNSCLSDDLLPSSTEGDTCRHLLHDFNTTTVSAGVPDSITTGVSVSMSPGGLSFCSVGSDSHDDLLQKARDDLHEDMLISRQSTIGKRPYNFTTRNKTTTGGVKRKKVRCYILLVRVFFTSHCVRVLTCLCLFMSI